MTGKCYYCGQEGEGDYFTLKNGQNKFICESCQDIEVQIDEVKIFNELIEKEMRTPIDPNFQEHYQKGVDEENNRGSGRYERERMRR